MMIGVEEVVRRRRQILRPSSPGSMMSRTMRSIRAVSRARPIDCASPVSVTRQPFFVRKRETIALISRSSSTTRMWGLRIAAALYISPRRRIAVENCFAMFPAGPWKRRATTRCASVHRCAVQARHPPRNTGSQMRQIVRFPRFFACAAIVAGVSVPTKLLAQDRPRGEWDVPLGAGAAVRPTYEGSDHYIASPVPFVNVIWRDTISLGVDGLSAYWRYENLRIGGGLSYGTGRTQ